MKVWDQVVIELVIPWSAAGLATDCLRGQVVSYCELTLSGVPPPLIL